MKKLKSESGSAMILALFLMILVSIVMISFSNQVANQLRSTINLDEDIQEKYDAESKIEESISNFIKSINLVSKEGIETSENNQIIKYVYYDLEYENSVDIKEVVENKEKVIMEIRAKQIKPKQSKDNPLKIFSYISSTDNDLNIDKFNGKKDQVVTFQLDIIELNNEGNSDNINSRIEVNVSDIDGVNGSETCNVNYKVVSWRTRN